MKLTKKGITTEDLTHKGRCINCYAEFEAKRSELEISDVANHGHEVSDMPNQGFWTKTYFYYKDCTECHNRQSVDFN